MHSNLKIAHMSKPLITVVIPLYNSAAYLENIVNLLNVQTLKDFEAVFVCDKSPDKTEELLPRALKNAEFRNSLHINPSRGGVGRARDYALDHGLVHSEYVIYIDADDSFSDDYFERLYNTIIQQNADMAICGFVRVERASGRIIAKDMCSNPERIGVSIHESLLSLINPAPWNKLIRVSCIGDSRFERALLEDVAFTAYILPKCRRIAFINEPLYQYFITGDSLISSYATKALPTLKAGLLEVAECYKAKPEIYLGFYEYLTALTFMRVGIGSTVRACLAPGVTFKLRRQTIKETRQYLDEHFPSWRNNEFLGLKELLKRGLKGVLLWRCRLFYKLHIFGLFVFEYKLFTAIFKKDIKW